MKEALFTLLGAGIGFCITLLHERLARLGAFRGKMRAHLIQVKETDDADDAELGKVYSAQRIGVLQDCEIIRPDIYCWRRKRFSAACAAYHTAQETDEERKSNDFVRTLYPDSVPLTPDQRTLKQRIMESVEELAKCAEGSLFSFSFSCWLPAFRKKGSLVSDIRLQEAEGSKSAAVGNGRRK